MKVKYKQPELPGSNLFTNFLIKDGEFYECVTAFTAKDACEVYVEQNDIDDRVILVANINNPERFHRFQTTKKVVTIHNVKEISMFDRETPEEALQNAKDVYEYYINELGLNPVEALRLSKLICDKFEPENYG